MPAQESAAIDLAPNLSPPVPVGDDRAEASAVLNQMLSRSLVFTDELRAIADRSVEAAPASSQHVSALTAALSRLIIDWIEDWPS